MIKKIIILIGIGLLIAGIFIYPEWRDAREEKEMLLYLTTEQLKDDYSRAKVAEGKIEGSEILAPYIEAGFYWKILADITKEDVFYKKTIETYEAAIDKFEMQYYMPYANLAGVYQSLGELEKAEEMLKKAIQVVPGESPLYIRLAELYRYDMNKSSEEILAIYERGMSRAINTLALVISKANYLRDIGQKQEALKLFETTYETTGSSVYRREVEQLRAELGMAPL